MSTKTKQVAWLGGVAEPEPMSEADVTLAIAIRRILSRFGSLAAFHEHLEAERTGRLQLKRESRVR